MAIIRQAALACDCRDPVQVDLLPCSRFAHSRSVLRAGLTCSGFMALATNTSGTDELSSLMELPSSDAQSVSIMPLDYWAAFHSGRLSQGPHYMFRAFRGVRHLAFDPRPVHLGSHDARTCAACQSLALVSGWKSQRWTSSPAPYRIEPKLPAGLMLSVCLRTMERTVLASFQPVKPSFLSGRSLARQDEL